MTEQFFERPILNSPYGYPGRHWELVDGQPTNRIIEFRRRSDLITPVPKSRKQRPVRAQATLALSEADELSTDEQKYNPTPIINEIRQSVEAWRALPNPEQWQVTPETARLLRHWRSHQFGSVKPNRRTGGSAPRTARIPRHGRGNYPGLQIERGGPSQ